MKQVFALAVLVLGMAAAPWSQIKLACIGNSITAAYGYPDSLRKLLGSGYTVQNDGVSSMTMLKKGGESYWTEGKLADVFAFKPNWVTIKLGTNDSKPNHWNTLSGDFKKDYLAMIDTLGTLSTKPKIWIVLPCPTWRTEANRPNDENLKAIVVILKQIAAERNLPIIDARTPMMNQALFGSDKIHPTPAGSDTLAHVIYRGLMAAPTTALLARGKAPSRVPSHSGSEALRSGAMVFGGPSREAQSRDARGALLPTGAKAISGASGLP